MELPRFKKAGEILVDPTLAAMRAVASEKYGQCWKAEHDAALDHLFALMHDGANGSGCVANDRITIEWKPIGGEGKPYEGQAVNLYCEPLLESDRLS